MNITDTLSASQIFEKAGFSSQQAKSLAIQHEAMAQELVANIQRAFEPQFALLEAKITSLESKMAGQITSLESKMAGQITSLESKMVGQITHLETKMIGQVTHLEAKMVGQVTHLEAKMDGKIEAVARDQLFKIVVLVLSSAGLTVGLLSLAFALAFAYFSR